MVYVYINMPLRKSGKTHVKHLFTVMTMTRVLKDTDKEKHNFWVYPSIRVLPLIHFRVSAGLDPIPHVIGYTLDGLPVYHRANTERQTIIQTHVHTYRQFRITN